jgi:hypothetical protein
MVNKIYGNQSPVESRKGYNVSVTSAGNSISIESEGVDTFVTISNLSGNIIVSEAVTGSSSFRVNGGGLYLVHIKNANITNVKKFIIR